MFYYYFRPCHTSGRGRLDFDRLTQLFYSWPNSRESHISECDKVRVYYFGHNSGLFCINAIDIFLNLSLQIFLPYDILGIFILFVLDQKKKFVHILDPLSRPTWGVHIFNNFKIGNMVNLALNRQTPNGRTTSPNGDAKCHVNRQMSTGMKLFT